MADYTLIHDYLGELRKETRWLRDTEEIAEEVADHLFEAVEKRVDRGMARISAQKQALIEFGDPALVGRAFTSSRTGGATVPTQFTRRAGHALMISAFLWVAGMAIQFASYLVDQTRPWEGLPQILYMIGAFVLVAAGLLGAAGVLGVNRRHGGSLGVRGRLAFWLFVVAGITVFATWFWGAWASALGLGAALIGWALIGSGIAPRSAGIFIAGGGLLAAVGLWSLQFVNTEISLDDTPVLLVHYAGLLLFVIGEAILGRWMANEEVVDQPERIATA